MSYSSDLLAEMGNQPNDEVIDDAAPFLAPVPSDVIDGLIGQYNFALKGINQVASLLGGGLGDVMHYFIEGNAGEERFQRSLYVDRLFQTDGAIKALNAAYWCKALNLTDVYDLMPQARRSEWDKSIKAMETPDFREDTVRATLITLLNSRAKFFAERVDGIFRSLSNEHLTNAPEGFGRRMILSHVVNEWGSVDCSRAGHINDLRSVIAKFMGRDTPKWNSTSSVIAIARGQAGEWLTLDGGSLRIRVYKKGTAHLEVHPEMSYRLNQILAHIHPMAIPSQFRSKPKKKHKEFAMLARPLPFEVISVLASMRTVRERVGTEVPVRFQEVANARAFDTCQMEDRVRRAAVRVLSAIGGVPSTKQSGCFQFDYDPGPVINLVVASGCIPDRVAYQFYATPERMALICSDLAGIDATHTVLEPSAGQGDLAAYLPMDRTTCVEISSLHCAILKARGFTVHLADFLAWADTERRRGTRFDRVVMNPPFSEGRARAHLAAAASLLSASGRLVAVLPASMRGEDVLHGFSHQWSSVYSDEFEGTGASVVILVASPALR